MVRLLLREHGPQTREQLADHYEQVTVDAVDSGLVELVDAREVVEAHGVWRLAEGESRNS